MRIPSIDFPVIGWREYVSLHELGIGKIKAKIDTGARTSTLHAFDVKEYSVGTMTFVRFKVHPVQRNTRELVSCRAALVGKRLIKDSGGKVTVRHVIETEITLNARTWTLELTLVNRDEMGFRMLLGRQAIRGHFMIDPSRSFLMSKKKRKKKA
ncbi:MAG: ATP-dependent zinc protease [Deltaproteobacteria bacterium]|nr:ATP-dependent zinc protease [Deltaproteobacteria bacterium]